MSLDAPSLPNDVEQLKAMIAQRDTELIQRDAVIAQNAAVIASQHETIEKQLSKLERLHQELARLLRQRYGPQKERIDPNQLTLFTAEELSALIQELQQSPVESVSTDDGSAEEESAADALPKKPKGHGRRSIPPEIPREIIVHELGEEERRCPCCGLTRAEIGREVSEQLEFIPARLKVLRHERVRYACAA